MSRGVRLLLMAAAVATGACGDGEHGPMMTGPGEMGPQVGGAAFMSITPVGGSTGVPVSTSITIRFASAMAEGMEQYVDLHVDSIAGPTVAMSCAWTQDRSTLTCRPAAPLAPLTTYLVHLGGGMTTPAGARVGFGPYGPAMGGEWLMGGMMGATHAGHPWGTLAFGWHDAQGGYGMAFPFTTA